MGWKDPVRETVWRAVVPGGGADRGGAWKAHAILSTLVWPHQKEALIFRT